MSNKTQLQTNNTKYASLIKLLRGKAVGGGSGGSGSVEACTVTMPGTNTSMIVGTTVSNGIATHTDFMPSETSLSVAKNSLLVVAVSSARYSASASGNASFITSYATTYVFSITDDATITIS